MALIYFVSWIDGSELGRRDVRGCDMKSHDLDMMDLTD
jgi:hypothetical protein